MIKENIEKILSELPSNVSLVAAAKTRTSDEIKQAIDAGITIIGENYVQEGERAKLEIRDSKLDIRWHFIGHLQKNKVRKAVKIFDLIETVDSIELASEINKRCKAIGKVMPILIEINSGREPQKAGVFPEKVEELVREISKLENVKARGLMTMGPFSADPEVVRPYFVETRKVFEQMKELKLLNVEMNILSMGMSDSYKVAIEEGANLVRIGTKIFGAGC